MILIVIGTHAYTYLVISFAFLQFFQKYLWLFL